MTYTSLMSEIKDLVSVSVLPVNVTENTKVSFRLKFTNKLSDSGGFGGGGAQGRAPPSPPQFFHFHGKSFAK